jgi:hypothetical protein
VIFPGVLGQGTSTQPRPSDGDVKWRSSVSVLYTEHLKEPEGLFEKELGTHAPGFLCILILSSLRPPLDSLESVSIS